MTAAGRHSHSIISCRHITLILFKKIISLDFYTVMHTVRKRRCWKHWIFWPDLWEAPSAIYRQARL